MFKQLLLIAAVLVSTACTADTVRRNFGVKKEAPDEFMVLSRPPLVTPPNFDLPEPQQRAEQFDRNKVRNDVQKTLTGTTTQQPASEATASSTGESTLLQRAGADQIDPNIRSVLNEEYGEEQKAEDARDGELLGIRGLLKPILPDHEAAKKKADTILDPEAEKKRLTEEKQQAVGEQFDTPAKQNATDALE